MAAVQTRSSGLSEVVDRILEKGLVIDLWAKVSIVGFEVICIEARVIVASVETYLTYAEAIGLTAAAAVPALPAANPGFVRGQEITVPASGYAVRS
jgi:hypothetical protein